MTFRQWIGFFVGTPQRLLVTVCLIGLGYGLHNPAAIQAAITGLLAAIYAAVEPFVMPFLQLGIMIGIATWMLKGIFGSKKGGK